MKRILLFFCVVLFSVQSLHAQELDKMVAIQLAEKNLFALGLSTEDLSNLKVSNAYHNRHAGTDMVYLQQQYKSIPILNQLLVLAFKNGKLVSRAGNFYRGFEKKTLNISETPSISAEMAAVKTMAEKHVLPKESLQPTTLGLHKVSVGKAGIANENITAELMWEIDEKTNNAILVWQVYLVPKTSSDYWLVRVNAHDNSIVSEHNLTVYCNWDDPNHKNSKEHNHGDIAQNNPAIDVKSLYERTETSPEIVNGASYRVIPFPAESPQHPGGAHALRTDPWTAAAGNATSLKWHSDGTDYTYSRGNNVWAYHDRTNTNTPSVGNSVASTTTPDPLSFNFTPNFNVDPTQTTPTPNQQFNITNLFYWNNVIHDVLYQYGFDEPGGNFQANNQGRGGVGNDYVMAEAQDGSGTNNANFATPADGGRPRMQMYLWDGPPKMVVNSPASIAGNYGAVESNFSTANKLANVGPVTAQVVWYNDPTGGTHEACAAIAAGSLTGKIALINRGNCNFTVKVKNAQDAGAVAAIVVNNVPDAPIIMGGGPDNTIIIPAVMISQADGAVIAAQLANNVNVTLSAVMVDGDVDNGVVVHEFGHGISNRLAGGPAQAGCVSNAEHMGEGWSDYFCLMLTQDWASSNMNTGFNSPRAIGTYAAGQPVTGPGIRSQLYTTNFAINNLVYTASLPGTGLQHTRGELWAATLWDMTWNIIQQTNNITPNIYNGAGTGGNVIALRLVMEGLKLQPCNSGFIDGRDAILKADEILYGGVYSCAIREAFRRRGMGAFASQGSANIVTDQVPDFSSTVTLKLTASATEVPEGQNVTYTNTLVSCGPVTNYIIRDTLPTNVTYVSGGTYDAATRVVSFPVNFTAAGTQTYVFTVMANAGSYYAPTTYLNEVVAAAAIPATLTATSTTATVWTGTSAQSHSAPNSVFSPNAAVPSEQTLRTINPIALGSNQSAVSFWHKYDTEAGYDGGVVEISTDGGTNWTDLQTKMILGYYNGIIDATAGTSIQGRKAYTGSVANFIKTDINLSTYAGQSALFRWRFVSDEGTSVTGWYVDDILVKNEAVINIRSSLFTATGNIIQYADTVTRITNTCTGLSISTQPTNQTACSGSNATFTVVATGTAPTYQWQVSTNGGGTWSNVTGATTATLTLTAVTPAMNSNQYRVIINNTCPSTVTSNPATLTVTTASSITSQPSNVTVCAPAAASFTVVAAGTALNYQWQVSTNGGSTWSDITGATAATYNIATTTAALNGNQYRVNISTCAAGGLTSNAVTLTVNSSVAITAQPTSQSVCTGANASFTVTATSAGTYQWQLSTNAGGTWTDITGATSASLTLTAVTAGMNGNQYRVVVSNTCPSTTTSNAATLTVTTASSITTQPTSVIVCAPNAASFTVVATGTSLTYQWQVSTNAGGTWTDIAGATSATYTIATTTTALSGNQYRVNISTCAAGGLTSSPVTLTVNPSASITTQPASIVACTGNNASFSVAATGNALTYQWQVSTDAGANWTNIAGQTGSTLTLTAVTAAMNNNQYRVVINGTCTTNLNSQAATLTVNNSIVISQQPQSVTLCAGLNANFSVTATGSALTYQWQVSTDGGVNYTNIAGATMATLTVSAVQPSMNNNRYRVVLNGACVSNFNSDAATLTVNSSVTITAQPTNQVGCAPAPASFSVTATGTTITYQWQVSTDGGTTFTNITGATAPVFNIATLTPALNGNRYRVIVTGSPCGSVTSNAATLTIGQLPTVTVTANPGTITPTQTTTLTANTSPAGTYTYQWFNNGVAVPGGTGQTLVVGYGDNDVYTVSAFNSNGCSNTSAAFSLSFGPSNIAFIYPSPNNGFFHVRYYSQPGANPVRVLNVFDSKGSRIFTQQYNTNAPYYDMQVNITSASAGIYIVELLDRNGSRIAGGKVYKY